MMKEVCEWHGRTSEARRWPPALSSSSIVDLAAAELATGRLGRRLTASRRAKAVDQGQPQ